MAYEDLILGFRFGVFFFAGGIIPNPIDIRFKRVSGLGATVRTIDVSVDNQESIHNHSASAEASWSR